MTILIKYIKQPTGNTCGPTCLKMIFNHIRSRNIDKFLVCGIDPANPEKFVIMCENGTSDKDLYTIATYTNNSGVLVEATIDIISELCGTDWILGTPPDRMEKGLKALDISYIQHQSLPKPFNYLIDLLNHGGVGILRTITKKVPHWIIVNGYNHDIIDQTNDYLFDILDPWLGEIKYSTSELNEIWKPRDYQFFEIILTNDNKTRD